MKHGSTRLRLIVVFVTLLMLTVAYFIVADITNILTPIPLDPFRRLAGGSWLGYRLGYYGTLLLVSSMFYSIVKRLDPKRSQMLGGNKRWLQIHIILAIFGSLLILIHAGLPFNFRYYDPFRYIRLFRGGAAGLVGFAGLATWFIPLALLSGFIGRYLYKRMSTGVKHWFRYWHILHILLTAGLYATGMIHLIVIVWLRFITL